MPKRTTARVTDELEHVSRMIALLELRGARVFDLVREGPADPDVPLATHETVADLEFLTLLRELLRQPNLEAAVDALIAMGRRRLRRAGGG
ncbi:MAG: hypothetical protein JXB32_14475 [Deltaproteobacteria bacterium]|nr:hypothetical protein [Deltaproteobacteria bacterium]